MSQVWGHVHRPWWGSVPAALPLRALAVLALGTVASGVLWQLNVEDPLAAEVRPLPPPNLVGDVSADSPRRLAAPSVGGIPAVRSKAPAAKEPHLDGYHTSPLPPPPRSGDTLDDEPPTLLCQLTEPVIADALVIPTLC